MNVPTESIPNDKLREQNLEKMPEEVVIKINNIAKCYRRYQHPVDRFKELIFPSKVRGEEFWALKNISFQIKKGESLGILGQNGSGKSTLLQIITGTLAPSLGTVQVSGRLSALLELGSGFNPDFTGRENVMINGRILGFSKKEIEHKLEEIIDFADIDDFVDQPVHTYSSGMFVRLAFAAAVVWDPEILIVDEALAVGDIFFQQKCIARIKELQKKGVTILFVSHDTQSVLNLCQRAVVLNHGEILYEGNASTAVERYYEYYYMSHTQEKKLSIDDVSNAPKLNREINLKRSDGQTEKLPFISDFSTQSRYGCAVGLISGVCATSNSDEAKSTFFTKEEIKLSIRINANYESLAPLNIGFHLKDRLGQLIVGTNTKMLSEDLLDFQTGNPFICQFRFSLAIAPGEYTLDVAVAENQINTKKVYDWINNALSITVTSKNLLNEHAGLYCPTVNVSTFSLTELYTNSSA